TAAMGMNRPSIYAAFGNKEELFRKALTRYAEQSQARLRLQLDAPTILESLRQFLKAAADNLTDGDGPRGCFSVQGALVGSDRAQCACEDTKKWREATLDIVEERLLRAVSERELRADADTRAL